jgi:hypothetical protein
LDGLDEQLLVNSHSKSEVFRFTWLRTFHNPVAIRVEIDAQGETTISLKVSDGEGGYEPGRLIVNTNQVLSSKEAAELRSALQFLKQCKVPFSQDFLDGATWFFEYKYGTKYCITEEQSPTSGAWYKLGLLLIDRSGYQVEYDEIY